MKIAKTTAHTLRVPFRFPLIQETQHALVTFVEIESDDGLKGHAFAAYPLRFSISDFINREAGPAIAGMELTDNLMAFVERKLFTLNTGHALTAYLGQRAGLQTIRDAVMRRGTRRGAAGRQQNRRRRADRALVREGHSMLVVSAEVGRLVDRFLQAGRFA